MSSTSAEATNLAFLQRRFKEAGKTDGLQTALDMTLAGKITLAVMWEQSIQHVTEGTILEAFVKFPWDSQCHAVAPVFWTAPENVPGLCKIATAIAWSLITSEEAERAFMEYFLTKNLAAHKTSVVTVTTEEELEVASTTNDLVGLATVYKVYLTAVDADDIIHGPGLYVDTPHALLLRIVRDTLYDDSVMPDSDCLPKTPFFGNTVGIWALAQTLKEAGHAEEMVKQMRLRGEAIMTYSARPLGEDIHKALDPKRIGDAGYHEDLAVVSGKMPTPGKWGVVAEGDVSKLCRPLQQSRADTDHISK